MPAPLNLQFNYSTDYVSFTFGVPFQIGGSLSVGLIGDQTSVQGGASLDLTGLEINRWDLSAQDVSVISASDANYPFSLTLEPSDTITAGLIAVGLTWARLRAIRRRT